MNLPVFALIVLLYGTALISGLGITYQQELRLLGGYLRQLYRQHRLVSRHRRSAPTHMSTSGTQPTTGTPGDGYPGDLEGPTVPFTVGLVARLTGWPAPSSPAPAGPTPSSTPFLAPSPSTPSITYGAELLAAELEADPDAFREDVEEVAREIWRRHHERQLAETNALFDALSASMDGWEHPVTAADYRRHGGQRPVSTLPGIQSPTMRAMATFSPETMIQVITDENHKPTVFSWTTGEYAMQAAPDGEVQIAEVVDDWARTGMMPATRILVKEKSPTTGAGAPRLSRNGVARHRRHRK